jgi:hypothetical protein
MQNIEIQRFRNPWLWSLLILVNILIQAFGLRQLIWDIPFGNKPASDVLVVLIMLIPISILFLFALTYLKVSFSREQLVVQYFPFLTKNFNYTDILELEIVNYSPFFDYGGWGIRWNLDGWAYIVSGNQGISLKLKNGKKYLIGIKDAENYKELIQQFESERLTK